MNWNRFLRTSFYLKKIVILKTLIIFLLVIDIIVNGPLSCHNIVHLKKLNKLSKNLLVKY